MRRALLALTGVVAGTTLLISMKSAPGAARLPAQVAADEARNAAALAALAASASPGPTPPPSPGTGVRPLPGVPTTTPPPAGATPPGPAPTTRTSTTRPATIPPPPAPPSAITGDSVYTEFGYVTVAITVANGRMTDVVAVEMPSDESRSVAISAKAAPLLRDRALRTQSASFDAVSGATWTSLAYMDSLASARDKAGL